jgi:hypothetical protein
MMLPVSITEPSLKEMIEGLAGVVVALPINPSKSFERAATRACSGRDSEQEAEAQTRRKA